MIHLKQRGFAVLGAILILVLLSILGIALTLLSETQQRSSVLDIETARALSAARAGAQWGIYQIQTPATAPACFANTNIVLTGELSRFVASVSCVHSTFIDGPQTLNMYTLVVNACNTPSGGACPPATSGDLSVQRQLQLRTFR